MLLQIKRFSEKILLPIAKFLKNVPANYFTFLGLVCAVVVFFSFTIENLFFSAIFLFLVEFFDQIDGIVARLQGPTVFGAFFDSTLDRVGDFLVVLGIIFGGYINYILGFLVILGSFLTSYTRAKIESLGIKNLYGIGLLERTDRIPITLIGTIFQFFFLNAIFWTMVLLMFGAIFTAIQRIIYAYKKFHNHYN